MSKQIFTKQSTDYYKIEAIINIRQHLYRTKRKCTPKLPNNLQETKKLTPLGTGTCR